MSSCSAATRPFWRAAPWRRFSPHYTWYFAWLALPSVIAPIPAVLWLSAAPVALYLDPDNSRFLWRCIVYLPAAALTIAALRRRRQALSARACDLGRNLPVNVINPLKDPRRYFEEIETKRTSVAEAPPVCLYLEVTNRCNLLCETCPRTFETLEPPADMSWELFTKIVDQVPNIARVVLHGVGEPMLVKELPRMIRYLKDRGTYVLFNTNGTLLQPKRFQELIDTRPGRAARVARCRRPRDLPQGARQGLLQPHRARRRQVHRLPEAGRARRRRAFRCG